MSLEKFFNTKYIAQIIGSKLPLATKVTVNKMEFEGENQIHSQPFRFPIKEMPFYASFKKASYTIEAAVVLPLFITLMVFGMFTFRVLQVQSGVQKSINSASNIMAVTLGNLANQGESDKDVDTSGSEPTIKGELSEAALLASTIALSGGEIVKNKVPILYVDGGAAGFNFLNTSVEGNYVDIQVEYQMTFPVGLLGKYTFPVSQRARTRKWVGYDKAENTVESEYVFITEKGEAYHKNYDCTYLNPSVRRISKADLDAARNKGGGRYSQCQRCKKTVPHGFIFITDYGTSWHSDINCKEIKHNIKKVPLEDVKYSMRPCSKCTKGHEH